MAIPAKRDGFSVNDGTSVSMIEGQMIKFVDGNFFADKVKLPADTTLVVVDMVTAWVHWQAGKPIDHRITQPGIPHPEREELPDQDKGKWSPGLGGAPEDPWKDTRYVFMIDPKSGADFTFVSDSFGGRKAVRVLRKQIENVRTEHPAAKPVVQLRSKPMSTKFGMKVRPSFDVIDWRRGPGNAAPPVAPVPPRVASPDTIPRFPGDRISSGLPPSGPKHEPQDMDDDIPF